MHFVQLHASYHYITDAFTENSKFLGYALLARDASSNAYKKAFTSVTAVAALNAIQKQGTQPTFCKILEDTQSGFSNH